MTSDTDDALSWDGDEGAPTPAKAPRKRESAPDRSSQPLPDGWNAVGRGSESFVRSTDEPVAVVEREDDRSASGLSTVTLLTVGIVGGIYLLYSVGWVIGGLRLKPLANFFVADEMFLPWFVLAVAAPALWFLASWVLTRGRASWVRIGVLLLGVVLLVPWPFVTVGVIGA